MNKLVEKCVRCKSEHELMKCHLCEKSICADCFIFHLNDVHNKDEEKDPIVRGDILDEEGLR